jgi:molecular chaperone GrpE
MTQDNKDNSHPADEAREVIDDNKNGNEVKDESEDDSTAVDVEVKDEIDDSVESDEVDESTEETKEQTETLSDQYLRLAAEFDNYKKRTAREFGDIIKSANTRLLFSLVEIMDNFERALSPDAGSGDDDAYRRGVELIYNQLGDLLQKEGITAIESVGQVFDPNYHEALMQMESDEYEEGIVCKEVQKGYQINNKVLRHARVVVSKGAPQNKDNEE